MMCKVHVADHSMLTVRNMTATLSKLCKDLQQMLTRLYSKC